MKPATFAIAAILGVGLAGICNADDIVASEQATGSKLALLLKPNLANATLSIAGPNDFHASVSSKGGALAVDLAQFGRLDDGLYKYQVTASSGDKVPVRTTLDNGRDKEPTERFVGVAASGIFRIKAGEIVRPEAKSERKDR